MDWDDRRKATEWDRTFFERSRQDFWGTRRFGDQWTLQDDTRTIVPYAAQWQRVRDRKQVPEDTRRRLRIARINKLLAKLEEMMQE